MLKIEIPEVEMFDENDSTFKTLNGIVLSLEHSLISVSKWESKWCVPFLSKDAKSSDQTLDYVKCMTLTQNVDDIYYKVMTRENIDAIETYIDSTMSATRINNVDKRMSREIITSEVIYYWMVALNIPFECQKWHLNRLLMLINICSIKQQPPKKMRRRDLLKANQVLNEKRRADLNSQG